MSIWHLGADLIEVILTTAALAQNVAAAYFVFRHIFRLTALQHELSFIARRSVVLGSSRKNSVICGCLLIISAEMRRRGASNPPLRADKAAPHKWKGFLFFPFRVTLYTSCLLLNIGKSYLALQLFAESYLPSETNNHFIRVHAGLFVSQHYRQFSFH